MANSFDIDLLPLYRRAGQDQPVLPGLSAPRKPRRTARSREADQLVVYLALAGNATLPLDLHESLTNDLVKTYYDTNGSVTAALRIAAEALNQELLRRNLQSSGSGQQLIGLLSLAALRDGQFYLAQCGPVFALYLSSSGTQELYDPALSGRGLGHSQTASLRYFHASLQPGDSLLLAAHPPLNWSEASLFSLYGQKLESQQQSLLGQLSDLNAVLLRVKPGSGRVNVLAGRSGRADFAAAQDDRLATAPLAQPPVDYPGDDQAEDSVREQALLDQYQPLPEFDSLPEASLPLASEALSVSPASRGEPVPVPAVTSPAVAPQAARVQKPARSGPSTLQKTGRGLQSWLGRLLPQETLASIPNSVMAFFALAVPLVVVAVATAVYFQRGLAAQSEKAYAQAVEAYAQAQAQVEPLPQRAGLAAALSYLDASDSYRHLAESQILRQQILAGLDVLDLVQRINYQPAIVGGLPESVRISQMVTFDADLYLLDAQNGKVIRAVFTNQGYQVDSAFQCGPGSPANVGPLIDLAAWPGGARFGAGVLAMDANGSLLFCAPGQLPQPKRLPDPPGRTLSDVKAFTLDQTDLYLLDPVGQAVWVYYNADFEGEPVYYFSDQVPALDQLVDLAATEEDVYLLQADGNLILCVTGNLGNVTPTRCSDPAAYIDMRAGRESTPLQQIPRYAQIQKSPPPDPSLYLVEPESLAIDRYSLRNLAYQSRFLPAQLPDLPATAAWVSSADRLIFLAQGNRVYYSILP